MAGLGWEWGRLAKIERPYLLAIVLGAGLGVAAWRPGPLPGWRLWPCCGLAQPLAWPLRRLWCALCRGWRHRADLAAPSARRAGWIATFLVVVIWGTDIGAYLAGRLLGGPKLAPRISPGKTWAGSIGGLLIAAALRRAAGGLHAGCGAGRLCRRRAAVALRSRRAICWKARSSANWGSRIRAGPSPAMAGCSTG